MRFRLVVLLVAVVSCAWPAQAAPPKPPPPPPRPNILMILSDDLGWPYYGFMGHPVVRTPNLDALARGGLLFTQAQVAAPHCELSSRAWSRGLNLRDVDRFGRDWPLMPETLSALGYRTWMAGKWWEGPPQGIFTDVGSARNPNVGREGLQAFYKAVDHMGSGPWFALVAPKIPHTPHESPPPFSTMYAHADPDPLGLRLLQYGVTGTQKYFGMISWLDSLVGEMLDFLDDRGLRQNTIVVYLTDNGAGLKRSKASFREAGIRTPIIVSWPGRITPRVSPALVGAIDLYPTFIDVAGGAVPVLPDARSLKPFFTGAGTPRSVYFSNLQEGGEYAVRDASSKLYTDDTGRPSRVSDLVADPYERKDALNTPFGKAVVARLKPALDAWRTRP